MDTSAYTVRARGKAKERSVRNLHAFIRTHRIKKREALQAIRRIFNEQLAIIERAVGANVETALLHEAAHLSVALLMGMRDIEVILVPEVKLEALSESPTEVGTRQAIRWGGVQYELNPFGGTRERVRHEVRRDAYSTAAGPVAEEAVVGRCEACTLENDRQHFLRRMEEVNHQLLARGFKPLNGPRMWEDAMARLKEQFGKNSQWLAMVRAVAEIISQKDGREGVKEAVPVVESFRSSVMPSGAESFVAA